MEELSLDNIIDVDDVELFSPYEETAEESEQNTSEDTNAEDITETQEDIEEGELFESESVGNEDIKEENKENASSKKDSESPNKNLYSSLATALIEEGVFPDLSDEDASDIKDAEDFVKIVDKQVQAKLTEKQRRIDEALNANIEPTEIRKYENVLNYLDSINDNILSDESEQGENIRKQLIYQDYINSGFSKERAEKMVRKSIEAGTDIEDAKEALAGNKEFFESQYNNLVKEAKQQEENLIKARKQEAENLKKSILEDQKVFGEFVVDKPTRQKVFDVISKPIYKDPNTGEFLTALQKYERENKIDFIKNLGLVFTLTDGFKNMDKLVEGKVKKEVKKGMKDLERVLNTTSRTANGDLKLVTSVKDDPDSYFNNNWKFDI